jgi:hypothetical protein
MFRMRHCGIVSLLSIFFTLRRVFLRRWICATTARRTSRNGIERDLDTFSDLERAGLDPMIVWLNAGACQQVKFRHSLGCGQAAKEEAATQSEHRGGQGAAQ